MIPSFFLFSYLKYLFVCWHRWYRHYPLLQMYNLKGGRIFGSAVRTKTVDRLILILLPWFLFKNRQALRQLLNPPYQIPMMLMRGGKKKELECLA